MKFIGVNASGWSLSGTDVDALAFFNANQEPVPSIVGLGHAYVRVFISYGGPDEPVARRFNEALRRSGVETYFYPESATFGGLVDDEMRAKVAGCDRVMLICSTTAPDRPGWRFELEEALIREQREGSGTVLVVVAIDDGLWTPRPKPEVEELQRDLRRRNVADFRGVLDSPDRFHERLGRVLEGLRRPDD